MIGIVTEWNIRSWYRRHGLQVEQHYKQMTWVELSVTNKALPDSRALDNFIRFCLLLFYVLATSKVISG